MRTLTLGAGSSRALRTARRGSGGPCADSTRAWLTGMRWAWSISICCRMRLQGLRS